MLTGPFVLTPTKLTPRSVFIITPCCYAAAAFTWWWIGPLNFKRLSSSLESLDRPTTFTGKALRVPKSLFDAFRLFFLSSAS